MHGSRLAAAALVLVSGAVHLHQLVFVYGGVPVVRGLFAATVLLSSLLAIALLMTPAGWPAVMAMTLASLRAASLVVSRTIGLFDLDDEWTVAAVVALCADVGTIVALLVNPPGRTPPPSSDARGGYPDRSEPASEPAREPAARSQAASTSLRATTLSAKISSAPSKIDRTRASTK